MSTKSKIEWTEQTWNPATGCTKISEGCRNCYAEKMAHRLKAMGLKGYENGFRLTLQPERLPEPLNRKKPTMYFVNSMSDIFHERIPEEYIRRVFDVIKACPQHTFQVLTKRADRMEQFFHSYDAPPNAWLGCQLTDGRILVVEYKGEHLLGSADTLEKQNLGALWEEKSNGQGLFLMATKKNDKGRDVSQQIEDKIKHI